MYIIAASLPRSAAQRTKAPSIEAGPCQTCLCSCGLQRNFPPSFPEAPDFCVWGFIVRKDKVLNKQKKHKEATVLVAATPREHIYFISRPHRDPGRINDLREPKAFFLLHSVFFGARARRDPARYIQYRRRLTADPDFCRKKRQIVFIQKPHQATCSFPCPTCSKSKKKEALSAMMFHISLVLFRWPVV